MSINTAELRRLVEVANDWPPNSKVWDAQKDIVDQAFGMIEEIERQREWLDAVAHHASTLKDAAERGLFAMSPPAVEYFENFCRAADEPNSTNRRNKVDPMSTQTPIKGYRNLSQSKIETMYRIKALGEQVGELVATLRLNPDDTVQDRAAFPDQRWVSIGATHLQEGFMALARSVAKPTTF